MTLGQNNSIHMQLLMGQMPALGAIWALGKVGPDPPLMADPPLKSFKMSFPAAALGCGESESQFPWFGTMALIQGTI